MKKRLLTGLVVLFSLVFGLAVFSACGGSSKITLSEESVTMGVGNTRQLRATAADGSAVTWTTSDATIVSIIVQNAKMGTCAISAVSEGEAILTATSENGDSAQCTVTVDRYTVELSDSEITILRKDIKTFESKKLTATVKSKSGAVSERPKFESADPAIVSVDESGNLTAHKIGTTTVTATHGTASATCRVNVRWENEPKDWYEVPAGGESSAEAGRWAYWVDENYFGAKINVKYAESMDSALYFGFDGNISWAWYGVQLFYNSPATERLTGGNVYKLTMKVDSDVAGWMTVNGTDVHLEAKDDNEVEAYFIYGGGAAISMQMAIHDKITDNINPLEPADECRIEKGEMCFHDFEFTPYVATSLVAPTAFEITTETKNVEITDENGGTKVEQVPVTYLTVTDLNAGEEKVAAAEGYELAYFKAAGDELPAFSQYVMKNETGKMEIKEDFIKAGEYTVKVRVYSVDARYSDSEWSVGKTRTVKNAAIKYDVPNTRRAQDRGVGRFYTWSEWGQFSSAKFENNTLSFDLDGGASWYSNQIYYLSNDFEPYADFNKVTFTFVAPAAPEGTEPAKLGSIQVAGKNVDIYNGENKVEALFMTTGSTAFTIVLGKQGTDGEADFSLGKGHYELKNIQISAPNEPYGGEDAFRIGNEAAAVANPGKLVYWYAIIGDITSWQVSVAMNEVSYDAQKGYTFDYTSQTYDGKNCDWGAQLFYKNASNQAGVVYRMKLTVDSEKAGAVTVNGQRIELKVGKFDYYVNYTEQANEASLKFYFGADGKMFPENRLTFTVSWETLKSLSDLTGVSVDADGTVHFTDPNQEGVARYEVGLFNGSTLVSSQEIEDGGKIDDTKHYNGTYTVKVRACGDESHSDTNWVGSASYTVKNGSDLHLGEAADAVNNKGYWYAWLDHWDWCGSQATVSSAEVGEDALTLTYRTEGNPSLGYGVQLFYKNPSNGARLYNLSFKITLSVDGTITVNDKHISLKANEETLVKIGYNEGANAPSVSIQMGVYGAGAPVMSATVRITELKWEETAAKTLTAPTALTIEGGNVNFNDVNTEGVDYIQLGFFRGETLTYAYAVEKGDKLATNYVFKGEYTVKVRAVGFDAAHLDSAWSDGVSCTVASDPVYDIITKPEKGGDPNYVFFYWAQWNGIVNGKYENGALSFDIANGGNWDSNQIFYKLGVSGKATFTVDLDSSVSGYKVALNGNVIPIEKGKHTITIEDSNIEFSLLMGEPHLPYWDGTVDFVPSGSFTFSNFKWTTADGKVYTLSGLQA